MMKKILCSLVVLTLVLGLTAAAMAEGDMLARIQEKGEIVIATEGTWAPWTYTDENGNLVVVKVHYHPETGLLEFNAPMLGDFQLVCFHWEGTNFESPEFLEALKAFLG